MSKYSLINVSSEVNGIVSGVWIQDFMGTLEAAKEWALGTEKANSNKITVAVVDHLPGGSPNYSFRTNLQKL
jgi:hypothetical protein